MTYTKENIKKICNVSRETLQDLQTFHDILLKWQKAINLISSNTIQEVWHRHIADSIQLIPHIPKGTKSIVDLGSGWIACYSFGCCIKEYRYQNYDD